MLLANRLALYAREVVFGDADVLETVLFVKEIAKLANLEQYRDQRIVLKGCGDTPVPVSAYVELTKKLTPDCKKPDVWRTLFHSTHLQKKGLN